MVATETLSTLSLSLPVLLAQIGLPIHLIVLINLSANARVRRMQ
jgi:hypothetical protein